MKFWLRPKVIRCLKGVVVLKEFRLLEQRSVDDILFPLCLRMKESVSKEEFYTWAKTQGAEWRRLLLHHGAILLRGCPVDEPQDFERLLDDAGFPRMPYVGGAAPRNAVTSRVLTSNESPPSEPIPFHHEMAQVPNPPAYIFFYCDLPPEEGGETPIVHSHQVYKRFVGIDCDFAAKVERTGVRYIRIMPEEDDPSSAIGRSWKSTFLTDKKSVAEEKMRQLGTTWTWLADGNLRTETATVPGIRVEPRTQRKTFFNSMVAAYTGWIDQRNDPTKSVTCGDGTPVDGDVLLKTGQAMLEECVAFVWQKGDVLLIDNQLVLHSRRPFSGKRRILASISPME